MSEHEMIEVSRSSRPALWPDPRRTNDVAASIAQRNAVDGVTCRLGDSSCAGAHAKKLARSGGRGRDGMARSLLRLQRQYGNGYVGRVIARAEASGGHAGGLDGVEQSINAARGGGQHLDHGMRKQMESAFGADFGSVRVHTDARADNLNHSLSARAFATGSDIFFRQGEYQPGTSHGRELLAHELTHVVQQNGDGIRTKMSVSQPDDPQEVEADAMARAVMQREHQAVGDTEAVRRTGDATSHPTGLVEGLSDKDEDKNKKAV